MSRDSIDPRIEKVLNVYDQWHAKGAEEFNGSVEAGRFVEQIMDQVDWGTVSRSTFVAILGALAADDGDELLNALASEADSEHRIYLQCTIGNEISERLQSCGIDAAKAEKLAHQTIDAALSQAIETESAQQ